jgi:hypothetical protein
MTEAEWLKADDTVEMFDHLKRRARSERARLPHRRLRLYACACCRRVWHLLADARSRTAVELSERYADGQATRSALAKACRAAGEVLTALMRGKGVVPSAYSAAETAMWASADSIHDVWGGTSSAAEDLAARLGKEAGTGVKSARVSESRRQADLMREVFGNPFRPASLDRSWLTADVAALARAAYEERRLPEGTLEPARLALLADALEDAGCASADLLAHLRSEGPHVRGCWAVDLILGKK